MKPSIFITGASGFLGRTLLGTLDSTRFSKIYCLDRSGRTDRDASPVVVTVPGDLLDPSSYLPVLKDVQVVVHMAAQTGKARAADYRRINVEGTRCLVDACRQSGVERFVFLSSIAAAFKKIRGYHYARSKQQAERIVSESGLDFAILRPTMIFGSGSPVQEGLTRLARLPFVPVFGGGKFPVQPVAVADVARVVAGVVSSGRLGGDVMEIGGPEALPMRELIARLRGEGSSRMRVLPVPMWAAVAALTVLDPLVGRWLPVTLGQLASFRNDGRAAASEKAAGFLPDPAGLDAMLPSSRISPDVGTTGLERECRVLCRHLVRRDPSGYVIGKYLDLHRQKPMACENRFDTLLLKMGSKRPFLTKFCDAYARFFRPHTCLRQKLIYLLAILEVSPEFSRFLDEADGSNHWWMLARIGFRGGLFGLQLLAAAITLLPLQVLLGRRGKHGGRGGSHD